jgi:predicted  nucleic acid-binding Zn-ribbon protein
MVERALFKEELMYRIRKKLMLICFSVCLVTAAMPVMGASPGITAKPAMAVSDAGLFSWRSFWQGIFGGGSQSSKPPVTAPAQTEKSTEQTKPVEINTAESTSQSTTSDSSIISDTNPAGTEANHTDNAASGNTSIEKRLDALETYKSTSEDNIKQINNDISNAVKRITSTEQLFTDVNKRIDDVNGSIGDISQRLAQVEEKVKNIGISGDSTEALNALSDRVKSLEDMVTNIGSSSGNVDVTSVSGRLAILEKRVADMASGSSTYGSGQINEISTRLKNLEGKLGNVESRLASVEKSESITSGEMLSVSSSVSQAKDRISELEADVELLSQTSGQEQKDIAAVTLKLTEIEEAIKAIDSGATSGSSSEVGQISGKLASIDADLELVHKTIESNANNLDKLTGRLTDAEKEIGDANSRLSSIEGRLISGGGDSSYASEKFLEVEEELAGAAARVASAEERLSANEERLTAAETKLAESDVKFSDLDARISASDSRISDEDIKISSLEKKIEALESQLEEMDSSSGSSIAYTDTSRYVNVTTDFGDYNLDSTGYEDVSGKLNYILNDLWEEVAGRTLFFPSGIYRFESPVVCANDKLASGKYQGRTAGVTFLGESQFGTEFRFNCPSGQVPMTFNNGHRIRLFSITFVNDNENPADMVYMQSECFDTFINDCRFLNCIRGLHIKGSMYSYIYQTHFANGKGTGVSDIDCNYELWYEDGEYGYVQNCSFEGKFNDGKGVGALTTNSLLIFFDKIDFCNWYSGSAVQVRGEGGYTRGSGSHWFTNCMFMRNKKSIDLAATGTAKKGVYNISVSGCAFSTLNEVRDAYVIYAPNRLVRGLRISDSYVYGSSSTGVRIKLPDDFYTDLDNRDVCRLDLLIPNDTSIKVEPAELKDKVKYESIAD